MDVRGSKSNSPVKPQARVLKGEYLVQDSIRLKSPGIIIPGKGTNLTTEGVRTISGGIDSMKPGKIRGGLKAAPKSVLGVSNDVTPSTISIAENSTFKSPVKTTKTATFGNGNIKVGRTTGTYTGGGIISRKIAGTRGLSYI